MLEEELPDSDSSDEDFRPEGAEEEDVVEDEDEEVLEDEDEEVLEDEEELDRKRPASDKPPRRRKKRKTGEEECVKVEKAEEEPLNNGKISLEDKKKKADALWADFLKDCGPGVEKTATPLQAASAQPDTSCTVTQSNPSSKLDVSQSSKMLSEGSVVADLSRQETGKVVQVYEFAGEQVVVEKKVNARSAGSRGGGVSALLSQLTKKNKLSTLEKSKLDWNSFKEKEGISEQLSAYNRGKNGYLEKQDFLERSDLRKFEIEKQMRAHTRSKRL